MKNDLLKHLFLLILPLIGGLSAATRSLSLDLEDWKFSPEVKTSTDNAHLQIKSLASSIWLAPETRLDYTERDVLDLRYALRGGNLVVQANWFDAGGQFLETTTLGQATAGDEKALFRVTCNEDLANTDLSYEIKIWVEANMPRLELESVRIYPETENRSLLSALDFENQGGVSVSEMPDGSLRLNLSETADAGSVLSRKRLSPTQNGQLEIGVAEIAPDSAISVQMIFWSDDGQYLGYTDLLKDVTQVTKRDIDVDAIQESTDAAHYSFKLWLSGASASARLVIDSRAEN